jgi:hypothetical protein
MRLYIAGYVVLIAGSIASSWVFQSAAKADARRAVEAEVMATRAYQYRLEATGGKANVLGFELEQWLASLLHGTRLAYTLAVLSFAAALACFLIAFYLPQIPKWADDPPKDKGAPRA